jgi:hypothetical protein
MIGASQVLSGRRVLVRRGVRSLVASCRNPTAMRAFQMLGVTLGYESLRRQRLLVRFPGSAQRLRACITAMSPTTALWESRRYVGNRQAVEYAAYRIARRLGFRPRRYERFAGTAERILDEMPRLDGPGGVCIIGDPPVYPLAYHVLTTVAMRLAGRPIECAERALAALQAPNGDVAWSGRSYLQSWTLAAQVYHFGQVGDSMRASRSQLRLQRDYLRSGRLLLNPCDCLQDFYATRPTYTGLTALFLLLTPRSPAPVDPRPTVGGLSLDTPLYAVEAAAGGWRGIRRTAWSDDGRYAAGVVREQVLEGDRWRTTTPDLVP